MANEIAGQFNQAAALKIGVCVGRFNAFVVEPLLDGALDTLNRYGVASEQVTVARVPGALEIPLVCQKMAQSGDYDAVIALGAVIRGHTTHYELVTAESAKGLSNIALATGVPVINGIITTENIEQAIERAGSKAGNKGAEAALVAIEMASVIGQL